MSKMAPRRLGTDPFADEAPVDARPPGTVRCTKCLDAGWHCVESPNPEQPNRIVKCDRCDGNGIRSRADQLAAHLAWQERHMRRREEAPAAVEAETVRAGIRAVADARRM